MNNNTSQRRQFTASLGPDFGDLQGLITSGFDDLDYTAYLFLHFSHPALSRAWLTGLIQEITTADWKQPDGSIKKPELAVNIAFSHHGLGALGFPPDALHSFPSTFVEGMGSSERCRRLGDSGGSSPEHWEIGNPSAESSTPIDVLLMVQAPSREILDDYHGSWLKHHGDHAVILAAPVQYGATLSTDREHFGFADGISQPQLMGAPGRPNKAADGLPAGEFVLGYLNAYDMLPATPMVGRKDDIGHHLPSAQHREAEGFCDFGRNGTYVVFRKLTQDVMAFRKFVKQHDSSATGLLAAKMVGRWPSGAPLVKSPLNDSDEFSQRPNNNAFGYHFEDPDGLRCPMGAHIRRTNPRDGIEHDPAQSLITTSRHRLLRRGITFGELLPEDRSEDDGISRGLYFICLNADIRRQFEFVQQTWANNPKFAGLSHDRDPITGSNLDPAAPDNDPRNFTIQGVPFRTRCTGLPRFVRVRGGGYFFMPSVSALRFLAFSPAGT